LSGTQAGRARAHVAAQLDQLVVQRAALRGALRGGRLQAGHAADQAAQHLRLVQAACANRLLQRLHLACAERGS